MLREEGLSEAVPGKCRHDGINAMIKPRGKEGERSPVRRPSESDHRIVAFLGDLRAAGGKINKLSRVCTLVGGIVQVDPAPGFPEASSGVDDHCVTGHRECTGSRLAVVLGAT